MIESYVNRAFDISRRAVLSALVVFSVYWLTPYTTNAETQRDQREAIDNASNRDRQPVYEGLILLVYESRVRRVNDGVLADVEPVLLVKGSKYVDPVAEARKIGLKRFTEQWLGGNASRCTATVAAPVI